MRIVEFHPDARREADEAYVWYVERNIGAAANFKIDLDEVIEIARETPLRYPSYIGGTRRGILARFKYLVVFVHSFDRVQVIAVAHGHREPGYWTSRLDII